jgi:hypothetical protein
VNLIHEKNITLIQIAQDRGVTTGIEMARLLALACERGWDVCLGSRNMGTTIGQPRTRRALLAAALQFQRLTTGLPLTDVHNGLRVISRRAAMRIELKQNRMAHASELVSQLATLGLPFGDKCPIRLD